MLEVDNRLIILELTRPFLPLFPARFGMPLIENPSQSCMSEKIERASEHV